MNAAWSSLANQISASFWSHLRGVRRARGNVAPVALVIRVRLAIHGQRHFAAQDDMRSFHVMRVVGVVSARGILPNVGAAKSLPLQLFRQLLLVHRHILHLVALSWSLWIQSGRALRPSIHELPSSRHDNAPSALMGADAERARRLQERSSLFCERRLQLQSPAQILPC